MNDTLPIVTQLTTLILLTAAARVDLRERRIPNLIPVAGALLGLALQFWFGGLDGLQLGVAGLALGLLVLIPGYLAGVTGAGDVKLMAAVGALLGAERLLLALLLIILAGGLMGGLYALSAWWRSGARGPFRRYGGMLRTLWTTGRVHYVAPGSDEAMGARMPFALPIAVGATAAAVMPL